MSINLSLNTNASFDIPLEQLVEYVFDKKDELLPHIKDLHQSINFFNGHYSVNLTDWKELSNEENTYLCISGGFDVNDDSYLTLRVHEGYNDGLNGSIVDTDGFLDIKVDRDSLAQAIDAINDGTIPLHNKGLNITESNCPFALFYDDE
jgi:hypothetical protein